jgi:hypothetical protein
MKSSRKTLATSRIFVLGFFFGALLAGCTHHADPARELSSAVAPFSQARDRAVGLVANAKHSLGAADLNTLAASYAPLEESGNAYAGFLVEAVTATSFDSDRNAKYASSLAQAIKTFNKSFASISPPSQAGATVPSDWIPAFSDSVAAYWRQYRVALGNLSLQAKADLVKELKAKTVWPNYENIATEAASTPTPRP